MNTWTFLQIYWVPIIQTISLGPKKHPNMLSVADELPLQNHFNPTNPNGILSICVSTILSLLYFPYSIQQFLLVADYSSMKRWILRFRFCKLLHFINNGFKCLCILQKTNNSTINLLLETIITPTASSSLKSPLPGFLLTSEALMRTPVSRSLNRFTKERVRLCRSEIPSVTMWLFGPSSMMRKLQSSFGLNH